jgi:hypothetical protein
MSKVRKNEKIVSRILGKINDVVQAGYDNKTWLFTIHRSQKKKIFEPYNTESDGVLWMKGKWGANKDKEWSGIIPINSDLQEPIILPCNFNDITYSGSKYENSEKYMDQKKFYFYLFVLFYLVMDIQMQMTGGFVGRPGDSLLDMFLSLFNDPIITGGAVGAVVTISSVMTFTKGDQSMVMCDITRQLDDPGNASKVGGVYQASGFDYFEQGEFLGVEDPGDLKEAVEMMTMMHEEVLASSMRMTQKLIVLIQKAIAEASNELQRFKDAIYLPPEAEESKRMRDSRFHDSLNLGMVLAAVVTTAFLYLYFVGAP